MNVIRVIARIIGALVVLAAVIAGAIVLRGWSLAEIKQHRRVPDLRAATDTASIARGRHLAAIACAGCHGPTHDEPLSGGSENFLAIDSTHVLGTLWAPNLTPGGVLAHARDGEVARALREGIGADGHALLIMP